MTRQKDKGGSQKQQQEWNREVKEERHVADTHWQEIWIMIRWLAEGLPHAKRPTALYYADVSVFFF